MGFCTFMKTVEVTRHKEGGTAGKSTIQVAKEIFAKEGIRGMNKGVNAVAVRQTTNWGSRFGLSRIAEDVFRRNRGGDIDPNSPLSPLQVLDLVPGIVSNHSFQRILASAIGGGLSCWNQPIEVIRVEMQSQIKTPGRPEKMTIAKAGKWIYQNNGALGFYRGVT